MCNLITKLTFMYEENQYWYQIIEPLLQDIKWKHFSDVVSKYVCLISFITLIILLAPVAGVISS